MGSRNFGGMLADQMRNRRIVCVGLDPNVSLVRDAGWVRPHNLSPGKAQARFCSEVVDATSGIVLAYKPNLAFFMETADNGGIKALIELVKYIHVVAPDVPVILDAKFGDIGNTNMGYVHFAFNIIGADAVTLHPYMGRVNGMQPFLDDPDKGAIVLCRTSNDGGAEFQNAMVTPLRCMRTRMLYADIPHFTVENGHIPETGLNKAETMPMYEYVAHRLAASWDANDNMFAVVGATAPAELAKVRKILGGRPILIPGLGAQGGDAYAVVQAGYVPDPAGVHGMVVNFSRSVIFNEDPGAEALRSHDELMTMLPTAA